MMDLQTIQEINARATKQARRTHKRPYVPAAAQRVVLSRGSLKGSSFPFLADYVPPGWERTDDDPMFIDMSGFGKDYEPAMTQEAFARLIAKDPPGTGYAMIEHGEFQCYIARYRRPQDVKADHAGTLKEILKAARQQVNAGEVCATLS